MDECGSVWLWKCFAANIAATFDQSIFVFALKNLQSKQCYRNYGLGRIVSININCSWNLHCRNLHWDCPKVAGLYIPSITKIFGFISLIGSDYEQNVVPVLSDYEQNVVPVLR
jgi:hypothetical protein